jgi:hypothetical protein
MQTITKYIKILLKLLIYDFSFNKEITVIGNLLNLLMYGNEIKYLCFYF